MLLRYTLFLIFMLSGFSGLIYESIWTHYLKLFLGHAAYAQTLVLVIFLGGLAAGSAISAKYSVGWTGLIKRYAIIEGLIGILALFFHDTFLLTTDLTFNQILPAFADMPTAIYAIKYSLAALLILPQSVLLGMTFPLMVGGLLRIFPDNPAKSISILYFTNSFGAVIGVLASSFILIDKVGLPGTVLTAGILNILLAIIVWAVIKNNTIDAAPVKIERVQKKPDAESTEAGRYIIPGLLLISFFTGFSSFLYEIGWIRMLTLVMGSSTHSFEIMLAVFILGLASGSLWLSQRKQPLEKPWKMLAIAQIVMGMGALLSVLVYMSSYELMSWLLNTINHTNETYPVFLIFCGLIALLIMLPATFCAGMTLPLVTHLMLKTSMKEKGVGAVYTLNTLGAIIAIILATHLFMPLIGLKGLIVSGSFIDLILGLMIVWYVLLKTSTNKRLPSMAALVASLLVFSTVVLISGKWDLQQLSSGVFRFGATSSKSPTEVIFHEDGKTSTVAVKQYLKADIRVLLNNGKPDASMAMKAGTQHSGDEATQFLLGALPLIHKPGAESVAVIGLGSGVTPSTVLLSDTIKQVDSIEIEKAVVTASNLFRPFVDRVYDDPRSHIHVDDAKTFFSVKQQKYDVIVSEPPNPWVSGVSTLFSQEFYSRIKTHLKQDGLLVQWMHLYEITPQLVATVMNAIGSEFEDYQIYAVSSSDVIIVASPNNTIAPLTSKAWSHKKLAKELLTYNIKTLTDINVRRVGNKDLLQALYKYLNTAENSDYFPILDNNSAKSRFTHDKALALVQLNLNNPFPLTRLIRQHEIDANKVIYSHYQTKTHEYYNATNLMQHLMTNDASSSYGNLDNKDTIRWGSANTLKSLLSNCSAKRVNLLNDSIHLHMTSTMPYLEKKELQKIINMLEGYPCVHNSMIQPWMTVYKSIIENNWEQLYKTSTDLLNGSEKISQARKRYLLTAYMYSKNFVADIDVIAENNAAYSIDEPGMLLLLLLLNPEGDYAGSTTMVRNSLLPR
jgi:spermidine synthase